ncbi:MAG: 30S ribosomal protein S12 methylthiotransferase RimO [Gemmatimonadota bacterium]|nr:30S ribosomal protein S12 methylthiotransferase RimO [Gemmatimonadota bacterium]
MKIGLITLGCDKNTVDSERYLAALIGHGAEHTTRLDEAEVIVVNTCGFIDAAKQESIDTLIAAGRLKVEGVCRAVVAVGCLVQRHERELAAELPEVDLFLGSSEMHRLIPELERRGLVGDPVTEHPGVRQYAGDLPHVRYLKVSEGCDHGCAFCAIPLMRGRHRSFSLDDVLADARLLEAQGAREVNLVAQDLAHYGRDRRDGVGLAELLDALIRETGIPWLRMLYLYATGLTPRLLELMARERRIVPYLDIPIQHASDSVLARMRRPERARTIRERVARVRDVVPDLAIRTTCIVGFPGETDEDFQLLLEFLEEIRFERVGVFTYSSQEGTKAAELPDDVPMEVKLDRLARLSELQRGVTAERYERLIGKRVPAIVDRLHDEERGAGAVEARLIWQADDVDGITHLAGARGVAAGSIVDVVVDDVVDDFDFEATYRGVLVDGRSAIPTTQRGGRTLPLLASSAAGSFGR